MNLKFKVHTQVSYYFITSCKRDLLSDAFFVLVYHRYYIMYINTSVFFFCWLCVLYSHIHSVFGLYCVVLCDYVYVKMFHTQYVNCTCVRILLTNIFIHQFSPKHTNIFVCAHLFFRVWTAARLWINNL